MVSKFHRIAEANVDVAAASGPTVDSLDAEA